MLAFPIIIIAYRTTNKLYQSTGSGDGDYLQLSSHVVIESVDNIKTVVALGAEEYFVNTLKNHLHSHTRLVTHSALCACACTIAITS